jgi:hypothetical protein
VEKYEIKIIIKEIFMYPTEGFSKNGIKTIEHTSLKFYLTNNRVWWRLVPTNSVNK